jgi:hypothetical protein
MRSKRHHKIGQTHAAHCVSVAVALRHLNDGLRQVSRGTQCRRVIASTLQWKELARRRLRIHGDPRIQPHQSGA